MTESKSAKVATLDKAKWRRKHKQKDEKVEQLAERFAQALPDKATPVKDYLKKKRAKKKR
ncbi:tRNA (uracil-5-)-methyltransferase [Bermanella sp. R86510]|uniref:tRNA (uracil-5-)-methyltransferase n=1 Tax=unclassified Bermanella TaxID=2627862 RepID=UPI0037C903F5